jgi:HEAT repeat protein
VPLIRTSLNPAAQPQAGAEKIAQDLAHGNDDQRWDAARAAAGAPDGLRLLRSAMFVEREPRVLEAIFTSLARIGTSESAEAVLPCLRSDDSKLRTAALDALRAMPTATRLHLPHLLHDADPDVRLLACDLVREQTPAEAARLLSEVLVHDSEANVCAAAVEVLAETGGPDVLPLLAQCAARFPDDPFLAFAIEIAGERLGSQALNRD